jgi:hypothetical protein
LLPFLTQVQEEAMRIRHLSGAGLITLATSLAVPVLAHPQSFTTGDYEACAASFEGRVSEYRALHRRLERLIAPETLFLDPRDDYAARQALADLLRAVRPEAAEGELFTPDVAAVFRVRIAHSLLATRRTAAELLDGGEQEQWGPLAPPVVNGDFDWRWRNVMWPSILFALPSLPEDLEYRFVDADLILVDVNANLVVDILRDALPVD